MITLNYKVISLNSKENAWNLKSAAKYGHLGKLVFALHDREDQRLSVQPQFMQYSINFFFLKCYNQVSCRIY